MLAPEPFAVEEVGTRQIDAHLRAGKERDRVVVELLSGCATAQERLRSRVDAKGPIGRGRPSDLREPSGGLASRLQFAERARKELLATCEKARKRTVETRDDLTAQERQIAQLACDGLSNPEIGARLFLSPRTVEWHLRKVFGKLGIRSRHAIAGALASSGSGLVQA